MGIVGETLSNILRKYFDSTLDEIRRSLLLSSFLIKSLGIL